MSAVFSAIPMRTWRWLGVNEALVSADLANTTPHDKLLTVPANAECATTVLYRGEAVGKIRAELADGATLHLVKATLTAEDHVDELTVDLARGATFRYTAIELARGLSVATKVNVNLNGDGSVADLATMYLVDGDGRLDLNYVVSQRGRHTDATMNVSGALAGSADKVFRGTLDFLRGSVGSVGREREEVLLLSPTVRNRSVPLMLAGEDDVDGHHAVTIGKLDASKLFYLMSRGLSEGDAKRLAVLAAVNPVLDRLPKGSPLAGEVLAIVAGSLE